MCNPEVAPWVLAAALELFDGCTEPEAVTRCLEQTLARPDAQPIIGGLRVQRRGLRPLHWPTMPRRLRALRRRGAIGVMATQAYVERLIDGFLGLALWWYVALEGKRLRKIPACGRPSARPCARAAGTPIRIDGSPTGTSARGSRLLDAPPHRRGLALGGRDRGGAGSLACGR